MCGQLGRRAASAAARSTANDSRLPRCATSLGRTDTPPTWHCVWVCVGLTLKSLVEAEYLGGPGGTGRWNAAAGSWTALADDVTPQLGGLRAIATS